VICILTSLDHGAYMLLTLFIAALRFRGGRITMCRARFPG